MKVISMAVELISNAICQSVISETHNSAKGIPIAPICKCRLG